MLIYINNAALPPNLHEPCLVDKNHIPRFWAIVWSSFHLNDAALNTKIKKLSYIENLYIFADNLLGPGALDKAVASANIESLSQILEGFFMSIRNKQYRSNADEARWKTAFNFVHTIISKITFNSNGEIFTELMKRLNRIGNSYQQLHIQRSKQTVSLRALPANVVAALYEMLDPESKTNPFKREKTRWMVFTLFICLLHQGLRIGELLLQRVDGIKSAYSKKQGKTVYWLNVDKLPESIIDFRNRKPSIKNTHSIRQIPVSESIATLIQSYVENYRGKPNHPFLLNSARDTAISHRAVDAIFAKISVTLPKEIKKELKDRTGKDSILEHDLRHTSVVIRLAQILEKGVEMNLALQSLRALFGWSRDSNMPQLYAKAVFEDRNAGIWSSVTDDRIAMLRSIPKSK
jgi:integrase